MVLLVRVVLLLVWISLVFGNGKLSNVGRVLSVWVRVMKVLLLRMVVF